MMTLADRLRRYSQGKDTAMGNDLIKAADQIERLENTVAILGREVDARDQRLSALSEGIRECNRYCPALDALEGEQE